jgi:hypothetical protein
MKPESFPSLESLCGQLRMNGKLVVERTVNRVTLRVRYYPFWTALWCYGLMGSIRYFVTSHSSDREFNQMFVFGGPILATLFVVIAWHLDRQPPLLVHETGTDHLTVPRLNAQVPTSVKSPIGFGELFIRRVNSRTTARALYVTWSTPQQAVPVFVHHVPGQMAKTLTEFASITGLKSFQLPTASLDLE